MSHIAQITESLPGLGLPMHAQLLNLLSMALREPAFFATCPSHANALRRIESFLFVL